MQAAGRFTGIQIFNCGLSAKFLVASDFSGQGNSYFPIPTCAKSHAIRHPEAELPSSHKLKLGRGEWWIHLEKTRIRRANCMPYSVVTTRYSVLGTRYSVLSTRRSALFTAAEIELPNGFVTGDSYAAGQIQTANFVGRGNSQIAIGVGC